MDQASFLQEHRLILHTSRAEPRLRLVLTDAYELRVTANEVGWKFTHGRRQPNQERSYDIVQPCFVIGHGGTAVVGWMGEIKATRWNLVFLSGFVRFWSKCTFWFDG